MSGDISNSFFITSLANTPAALTPAAGNTPPVGLRTSRKPTGNNTQIIAYAGQAYFFLCLCNRRAFFLLWRLIFAFLFFFTLDIFGAFPFVCTQIWAVFYRIT
jgi:hypothetical protein